MSKRKSLVALGLAGAQFLALAPTSVVAMAAPDTTTQTGSLTVTGTFPTELAPGYAAKSVNYTATTAADKAFTITKSNAVAMKNGSVGFSVVSNNFKESSKTQVTTSNLDFTVTFEAGKDANTTPYSDEVVLTYVYDGVTYTQSIPVSVTVKAGAKEDQLAPTGWKATASGESIVITPANADLEKAYQYYISKTEMADTSTITGWVDQAKGVATVPQTVSETTTFYVYVRYPEDDTHLVSPVATLDEVTIEVGGSDLQDQAAPTGWKATASGESIVITPANADLEKAYQYYISKTEMADTSTITGWVDQAKGVATVPQTVSESTDFFVYVRYPASTTHNASPVATLGKVAIEVGGGSDLQDQVAPAGWKATASGESIVITPANADLEKAYQYYISKTEMADTTTITDWVDQAKGVATVPQTVSESTDFFVYVRYPASTTHNASPVATLGKVTIEVGGGNIDPETTVPFSVSGEHFIVLDSNGKKINDATTIEKGSSFKIQPEDGYKFASDPVVTGVDGPTDGTYTVKADATAVTIEAHGVKDEAAKFATINIAEGKPIVVKYDGAQIDNGSQVQVGKDITIIVTVPKDKTLKSSAPVDGAKEVSKVTNADGETVYTYTYTVSGEGTINLTVTIGTMPSGGGSSSNTPSRPSSGGSSRPSSGGTSSSTHPTTPTGPSATAPTDSTGKVVTWTEVSTTISTATVGSTVAVTLPTSGIVERSVLVAAAQSKVTVELKVDDVFSWGIDGSKINGVVSAVSFKVETVNIPIYTINSHAGLANISANNVKTFSISNIPFATLQPTLKAKFNPLTDVNKFANVYTVDPVTGEMVFVEVAKIGPDGNVELPVNGNGSFVVAVDSESKKMGDFSNDGTLDVGDARSLLTEITSKGASSVGAYKGDMNGDGQVNALDAMMVLKAILQGKH